MAHMTKHTRHRRKSRRRRHTKRKQKYLWWSIALSILIVLTYIAYRTYTKPVGRNKETVYLLVDKTTNLEALKAQIQTKVWPRNTRLLHFMMNQAELQKHLRPGRYAVTPKMTMSDLVKVLVSGTQTPVRLNLSGIRTEQELIETISKHLMMKADEVEGAIKDPELLRTQGLNEENVRSLFFACEYSLLWNITPKGFIDTILLHHNYFWNAERRAKADSLGITTAEVSALAAILESESAKTQEYGNIARLYLNRYRLGMKLQSDPTVKFALGDFSLRRILSVHTKVESPYNTYKYTGLTPGPIRLPRLTSLDYVLNAPEHNFLYMCAKEDFSGYHNFSKDYATHQANARRYQAALDARGIKK